MKIDQKKIKKQTREYRINVFILILLFGVMLLTFQYLYLINDGALFGKAIAAITTGNCDGEVLFKIYDLNRGHVELYDEDNYAHKICAPKEWTGSRTCEADRSNVIIRISRPTNAYAERHDVASPSAGIDICFEGISCYYGSDCGSDLCIASLSRDTRAHVAECGNYPINICCREGGCPQGKYWYYYDYDGDGYGSNIQAPLCYAQPQGYYSTTMAGDCDDFNSNNNPGAQEICDYADNDCDNDIDENLQTIYYKDADRDTFGLESDFKSLCNPEEPYDTEQIGDCDDNDDSWICTNYYADGDGDGHGNIQYFVCNCSPNYPYTSILSDDCDDTDININPSMAEDCNDGEDNDCDNKVDMNDDECMFCKPGNTTECEIQYGVCQASTKVCGSDNKWPKCTADTYGDWSNDFEEEEQSCDGLDNDCDNEIDEGIKNIYYHDGDGDGFGNISDTKEACSAPENYVADNADCNDGDGNMNPSAYEICNGIDDDCDTSTEDGYDVTPPPNSIQEGVCKDSVQVCTDGSYVEIFSSDYIQNYEPQEASCSDNLDNDCDGEVDADDFDCSCLEGEESDCPLPGVCVGAKRVCTSDRVWASCDYAAFTDEYEVEEISCDGLDNDCDNATDENIKTIYYYDGDEDGNGLETNSSQFCEPTGKYTVTDYGDCDDNDATIAGCVTFYKDEDVDYFGLESESKCLCSPLWPYITSSGGDCNDENASIHPDAQEVCYNDIDDDCDGSTDEGCPCEEGSKMMCGIDKGECKIGWQICIKGNWSDCDGIMPSSEICDNKDNDCDGKIDEIFDVDNDGYTNCSTPIADCNDLDKNINPAAYDICGDGIDQDCDGKDSKCSTRQIEVVKQRPQGKGTELTPDKKVHPCTNGIQDDNEEGIDCGGPCKPCPGEESVSIDEKKNWLWLLLPIILIVAGSGLFLTYKMSKSKPTKKVIPVKPALLSDQQLARDIWARLYKGEQLEHIKQDYASRGISPDLARRALVDFYMAEATQRKKFQTSQLVREKKTIRRKQDLERLSRVLEKPGSEKTVIEPSKKPAKEPSEKPAPQPTADRKGRTAQQKSRTDIFKKLKDRIKEEKKS